MQESVPFAVIGSNTVVEARGQRVRGRLYPWGIVEGKDCAFEPCSGYQGNPSPYACPVRSGKPVPLRLCEAEDHPDQNPHARPEGHHRRLPLRELQSSVHPEHGQVCVSVCVCVCVVTTHASRWSFQ